jgi:hypothetical protein
VNTRHSSGDAGSTAGRVEILFVVEDAPEGGLTARSADETIFTEAEGMEELRSAVRDAVRTHFDETDRPRLIRLHYVRDEVFAA